MARFRKTVLRAVWVLACVATIAQAAPFAKTIRFTQPDGTRIELWGEGDEFQAVFKHQGYPVVFDVARKAYMYAALSPDGSGLIATAFEAGKADPRTLGLDPSADAKVSAEAKRQRVEERFRRWDLGMNVTKRWEQRKAMRLRAEESLANGPVMAPPSSTTTGQKMGLCLLIDFDDDPATIPQADIVDFCNGDDYTGYGNNGSVKKYYQDVSNNMLTYSNVVTVYIRIPNSLHPKSYYNDTTKSEGPQGNLLIKDALDIMKALPNYDTEILPTFDALTVDGDNEVVACNVFYAGDNGGVWAAGLWPHSWGLYAVGAQALSPGGKKIFRYQLTNIGDSLELGTFCHENGHMLCGFPDIYDYDYDSIGGAGMFCLMDAGGSGGNPVQVCAYLKYAAGWATTVELTSSSALTASLTSSAGTDFNRFYRYVKPAVATEYYLFENRQKAGRDAKLPASGIAVWHIDEKGNRDDQRMAYNTSHQNYECTLMQADNKWHFEKNANSGDANDLYYQGNKAAGYPNGFSDLTSPSARWWDGKSSGLNATSFSTNGTVMTFNITPHPPAILTSEVLPNGRQGNPYYCLLAAIGGSEPYTWSVVSNALPSGLNLSPNGAITGLPEEATSVSFSIAVSCDNGTAATNQFSLTILPPFAIPFTETFENGGSAPAFWSQEYVTGTVPWVFRDGNGVETAHPAHAYSNQCNACFAVATNGLIGSVTRLVSPMIDFGTEARAAELTFWHYMETWVDEQDELRVYYKTSATGEWALVESFTASVGAWTQQRITLPETSRTFYLAFEGTANYGYGVHIDNIWVGDPTLPLSIATPSPLPDAVVNTFYSNVLTAVGGTAPYTFAIVEGSGNLPSGLSLSGDGVISGTPTTVEDAAFTVRVTDAGNASVSADYRLSVVLPRAVLFAEDFEHGGLLPSGWTLEYVTNTVPWVCRNGGGNGGSIHVPLAAYEGGFNAVLWWSTTTADRPDHRTKLVTPPINLGAAPANIRLTFWHCMSELQGDQDELRVYYKTSEAGAWHLLATYTQDVPDWTKRTLVLPEACSTYYLAFEGNAKYGNGVCIDDVRISDEATAPIITTASPLTKGYLLTLYSQTLTAVGGVEPYTWSVVSNSLPPGLTLASDGTISGVPTAGGLSLFRVAVTGADNLSSTNLFALSISAARSLPFVEPFENGGAAPVGWTQETVAGSLSWTFSRGSVLGIPSSPYAGDWNACLSIQQSGAGQKTKLVSPMLDLGGGIANPRLSFWLHMAQYEGDQDKLQIYYRTSLTNAWTWLASYTTNIASWAQVTLDLPEPSSSYFIAFEGEANWGYGVCLDDVTVNGDLSPYTAWKSEHFTAQELADGLITGDEDDPDGDGVVNALEYAMGLDPRAADAEGLPFGGLMDGHLFLSYRESKTATDVRFEVVACTNLITQQWSTNGVSEVGRFDTNTWQQQVTAWHDVTVTNAPQRFMRLRVYLP